MFYFLVYYVQKKYRLERVFDASYYFLRTQATSFGNVPWTTDDDHLPMVYSKTFPGDEFPTHFGYYVDDFIMSAPSMTSTIAAWTELGSVVKIGKWTQYTRFIGINRSMVRISDTMTCLRYVQVEYLNMIVTKFAKEAGYDKLPSRALPTFDLSLTSYSDEPGKFARSASTHVGGLLFYARMTAMHLLRAVTFLGRYVTCWTVTMDSFLFQLMCYISSHDECFHHYFEVRDVREKTLHVLHRCDSDLGGCWETSKSTGGCNVYLRGDHGTRALVAASNWRRSSVALSNGDAEVVTMVNSLKKFGIPVHMNAQALFRGTCNVPMIVEVDAEVAKVTALKGLSNKLRYMAKIYRLPMAWLPEFFQHDDVAIRRIDTSKNCSDVHTKHLGESKWSNFCHAMGIGSMSELRHFAHSASAKNRMHVHRCSSCGLHYVHRHAFKGNHYHKSCFICDPTALLLVNLSKSW